MALITSGCATQPTRVSRRGLLEYEGGSGKRTPAAAIASESIRDSVKAEERANELYTPHEGEKINLVGRWQWPLNHIDISTHGTYGTRGRKFHQGIDLRTPTGTPVYAASDGEVTYVGSKVRGYGKMVVLKHDGGFFSVYAHHSKNLVRFGSKVKRGDLIAYSGRTGHATGPHLHFEIRKGTQSYDPQFVIKNSSGEVARTIATEHSHQ